MGLEFNVKVGSKLQHKVASGVFRVAGSAVVDGSHFYYIEDPLGMLQECYDDTEVSNIFNLLDEDGDLIPIGYEHVSDVDPLDALLDDIGNRSPEKDVSDVDPDRGLFNGTRWRNNGRLAVGDVIEDTVPTGEVKDVLHKPDHYTRGGIEPLDYIFSNGMSFLEGNIIKYVTRYKYKNGVEDLRKAKVYLERLIKEYKDD